MLLSILLFLIELFSMACNAQFNNSNLNCFYDYEKTVDCEITSTVPLNCSTYTVELVSQHEPAKRAVMHDSRSPTSLFRCECAINISMPNTEKFTQNFLEGGQLVNTKTITGLTILKPRVPEILPVERTENGNYKVAWETHYDKSSSLSDGLEIQLRYGKKDDANTSWRNISAIQGSQEIPGKDLEPGSIYTVRARSHNPIYSNNSSDWSPEQEWTVSVSPQSLWRVIVPVLSVLLVIIICAAYLCWNWLKTQWWDRIPSPSSSVKLMLPQNLKVFTPKLYDPWSIYPDALTVANTEEQSWYSPEGSECDGDGSYKNVSGSQSAAGGSSGVRPDDPAGLNGSLGSRGSSQDSYRNVVMCQSLEPPSQGSTQGSTGCETPCSPSLPAPDASLEGLEPPRALAVFHQTLIIPDLREAPSVTVDFEYCPCEGGLTSTPPAGGTDLSCSMAGFPGAVPQDSCTVPFMVPCRADDGYESFSEAVARTAPTQTHIPACTLAPCEEGYQALQTMEEHREHSRSAIGQAKMESSSLNGPVSCTGRDQHFPQSLPRVMPQSIISECMPMMTLENLSHSALNSPFNTEEYFNRSYQKILLERSVST
ncbi:hypothetical protein GJAV_G00215610 [Gymnothorax javanicus]|nr:hypothetical protein GJAV_G00215610 [Gymnothorax javanicus]